MAWVPDEAASFDAKLALAAGERQCPAKAYHHHAATGTHVCQAFRVTGEPRSCRAGRECPHAVTGHADSKEDHPEGCHLQRDGAVFVADELREHGDEKHDGFGVGYSDEESSRMRRNDDGRARCEVAVSV